MSKIRHYDADGHPDDESDYGEPNQFHTLDVGIQTLWRRDTFMVGSAFETGRGVWYANIRVYGMVLDTDGIRDDYGVAGDAVISGPDLNADIVRVLETEFGYSGIQPADDPYTIT